MYRSCFVHVTVYSFAIISTTTDIQNCVTVTTSNLSNVYADLKNTSGVAAGLSQHVQTAQKTSNLLNPGPTIQNITTWVKTISSSITSDKKYWLQGFRKHSHKYPHAELPQLRRPVSSWTSFWPMFRVAARVADSYYFTYTIWNNQKNGQLSSSRTRCTNFHAYHMSFRISLSAFIRALESVLGADTGDYALHYGDRAWK